MLSANEAGAPSRALLSEIFAQYTPTAFEVLYCGDKPGAAAASTPAEQNWPTGVPMPIGNSASAGIDAPLLAVSVRDTVPAFGTENE
jgi:hypothetical protein